MVQNHEYLKLKPALVPSPLWYRSVCKVLGSKSKAWRSIRAQVLDAAKEACYHCGAHHAKGMICHEVWDYDDSSHIARLNRFNLVCPDCDAVLHFGFTFVLAFRQEAEGKANVIAEQRERVVAQLKQVNSISEAEALAVMEFAGRQHSERSRHSWQIEIASSLIDAYPLLANLRL
ncbi:MAG: hypothetical protein H0T73_12405 [Ardenticatenales bacterium]|nr:hypothetical protein [Ardenticatenales bacterium]